MEKEYKMSQARKDELEQDWEEDFPGLAFTVNVQVKVAGG